LYGSTKKKEQKKQLIWGDGLVFLLHLMCNGITSSVRDKGMNAYEVSIFVK